MKELNITIEINDVDGEPLHFVSCKSIDSAIAELGRFERNSEKSIAKEKLKECEHGVSGECEDCDNEDKLMALGKEEAKGTY